MARTRSLIPWLLLAVVALISYGSLYPFNFKPDAIEGGVLQALRQLSWARAGRGDRIANVLLYLPLGFCLFLWLNLRFRRRSSAALATALGALLSLAIEVAQVYISARVPSFADLALNTAGSALGAIAGLFWLGVSHLLHFPTRDESAPRDYGAALVIALWVAFSLAPFVPQLDLGKLKAALQPLFDPQFDAVSVFIHVTCWLLVNHAVASLVTRSRRLEALLLLIAAVLVGRLVLATQTFVADELLALMIVVPMLVIMHRLTAGARRVALLTALLAVLLIEGLAPFDFVSTPSGFDFWPFMMWFEIGPAATFETIDWSELFGHLFLFTALLWLLREFGMRIDTAIGIVTAAALGFEVLQLWLPGQSGSMTDPFLTFAVALLFRRLERAGQQSTLARRAIFQPSRNR